MKKVFASFAMIVIATCIFAGNNTLTTSVTIEAEYPDLYGAKANQTLESKNLELKIPIDKVISLGKEQYKVIYPIPGNESQTTSFILDDVDEDILELKIMAVRHPDMIKRIHIRILRIVMWDGSITWSMTGSGWPGGAEK